MHKICTALHVVVLIVLLAALGGCLCHKKAVSIAAAAMLLATALPYIYGDKSLMAPNPQ